MSYFTTADDLYKQMKVYIENTDTSENGYIYNALYPPAVEIAYCLLLMDQVENKVFASKAVTSGYSDQLELRCSELGIYRKQATYAKPIVTFTGKVGTKISSGFIVSTSDNRQYTVISDIVISTDGTINAETIASDIGSLYNVKAGDINYMPVKMSNIVSVTNLNDYSEAYDNETDQDLYDRYLLKVQSAGTSGNKADYENWCLECTGVGDVQVYPLKDENLQPKNGHVTCVITNSNKRGASAELITTVKNYIDPDNGTGEGKAPIGSTVHIISVEEVPLNIYADIQISADTTLDVVKTSMSNLIEDYLKTVALSTNKISIVKIGSLILDIDGIEDYSNLTINNASSNVSLTAIQVAVLGTIQLGIMS